MYLSYVRTLAKSGILLSYLGEGKCIHTTKINRERSDSYLFIIYLNKRSMAINILKIDTIYIALSSDRKLAFAHVDIDVIIASSVTPTATQHAMRPAHPPLGWLV